ncbi:MAG: hypothetical protein ABSC93_07485 [Bryobacteraceae bacterium]
MVVHAYLRLANGTIETFDYPGAVNYTVATAVSQGGAVAGYYADPNGVYHGFIMATNGRLTSFDAPGAGYGTGFTSGTLPLGMNSAGTIATAINDQGYVAGWFYDSNIKVHGFVRSPGGKITTLNAPGFEGTYPTAINDLGQVAGVDFFQNAFVLTPGQ